MVLFLSHSGNTPECVAAALQLVAKGVTMLTLTGNKSKLMEDCHVDALSDVAFNHSGVLMWPGISQNTCIYTVGDWDCILILVSLTGRCVLGI